MAAVAPARRGTTLQDPVASDWKPDLRGNQHEINEYLEQQGGYDLIDYLMKELMTKQPADPMQHMLDCLETPFPTGPLKVLVTSPAGTGRSEYSRKLAHHFGLQYISAGELLRDTGVDTLKLGFADDKEVAMLVMERVKQADQQMQGWVLDGFPRTKTQSTYLAESAVVPTHILALQAPENLIREKQRRIADGEVPGDYIPPEALDHKLRLHACHSSSALETYRGQITAIDGSRTADEIWATMEKAARMRPRSKGPSPSPRVVILGPRGTGAPEFASRLASRLGAVFVDGAALASMPSSKQKDGTFPASSILERLAEEDPMGTVGARLRQVDCTRQGWVLSNFPATKKEADLLAQDVRLTPIRVLKLIASADACVSRLRHILTDPVTNKVWTALPQNERIRKRLVRDPVHMPESVLAAHATYSKEIDAVMEALSVHPGRCLNLPAEGSPHAAFDELVEFVERPLPLPQAKSS
mmetsp:Transcript_52972/g.85777  ORF Transcript_52972/g.85777 Transcript_52972/m.85777 type:complete len:472 (+) Transcript_52972:58-1473(+)